jgi:Protein of unknown function (DUF1549)/Protein of unknown function (DUF1553)
LSVEPTSARKKSKLQAFVLPAFVVVAVCAVVGWAARSPVDWRTIHSQTAARPVDQQTSPAAQSAESQTPSDIRDAVLAVDQFFAQNWRTAGVNPAPRADDLQILRRLTLALCGTIPSLEEIREFESDSKPGRLDRWTVRLLADNRFADYFAERLARSYVGTDVGQVVVYRRDRFVDWLRQQLAQHTPYDAMARSVISETGLWTDHPATNYITSAMADGELDRNKLAGRTARAFLGQRIDCAQCHDHPFAQWKQGQFQGLAALFGQAHSSLVGVEDKAKQVFEVEDRKTLEKHVVDPAVPFHPEWLPSTGSLRERLAAWVTHPQNQRFERATVNRIWGLLYGRPIHHPVDDLPDPPADGHQDVLDLVGADFRAHGCDLRHMIRVIVASRPFQLDSARDETASPTKKIAAAPANKPENKKSEWAESQDSGDNVAAEGDDWSIFPMTRLRPEQLIGAILQSTSLRTIDQNSHLLLRAKRYFQENEFVKQYGDMGDNELEERSGTIAQALLRMNGKLAAEALKADPFSSVGRISGFAGTNQSCLETCYLVALNRRPTKGESDYFVQQLACAEQNKEKDSYAHAVEDVFWSLYNSPEFSWNH